jgi:hypothetical protein
LGEERERAPDPAGAVLNPGPRELPRVAESCWESPLRRPPREPDGPSTARSGIRAAGGGGGGEQGEGEDGGGKEEREAG